MNAKQTNYSNFSDPEMLGFGIETQLLGFIE